MNRKINYCLLLCFFIVRLGFSQSNEVTVSGKVTAGDENEVLNGVSISVKNTSKGTASGVDGNYTLSVPRNAVLIYSYQGYEIQEVAVKGKTSINVSLKSSTKLLNEVVVVGYTQQTKAKTTAAISKLNPEELRNTSNPNPVQALQGKIAGVSIPINSGQPGVGAGNIIIRGGTKTDVYGSGQSNSSGGGLGIASNSNPYVLIDGVERSLNDINPDNIESLQVMKDAASTAIYGARGANGVIVVKTKGGKFNTKMNITVNHRTTWETAARQYKYLNAEQFLKVSRTILKNTHDFDPVESRRTGLISGGQAGMSTMVFSKKGDFGNSNYTTTIYDSLVKYEGQGYADNLLKNGWQTMDDPINPGVELIFYDNHYQDLIWNTGITNNDNISIDGGSDRANYNISAGYTRQAGTFVGTQYKRYDVLGNFGFKASEKFRIDAMINYQNLQPNYVEKFQDELIRGVRITPLHRIFKDDGNPTSGESYTVRNRLHTVKYDDVRSGTESIIARLAGDYTIIKGLHFKPSFSYLINDFKYLFMRQGVPATDYAKPATQRQKNESVNFTRQLMIDQVLQYDFNINKEHNFTVLGGFNYQRNRINTIDIGSQRATNDYIFTIEEPTTAVVNGVTTSNVTDFGTNLTERKSASFFGQALYDYNAKYLFGASLRYDGFSNFAPENKYAYFPSLSAGWNIHKENFFNIKPISLLKLRASWGYVGASDLSVTDTYGGYRGVQYGFGSGILRSNLANPNLLWEKTMATDLAIDAGLFNNRVTLSVDFYDKQTQDRLDSKPLPGEAPFSSIRFNNGTLQNRGVEVELGAEVLRTKDFKWRSNFSFAINNQKITKLPNNGRLNNRQGGGIIYDPSSKADKEVGGLAEGERPFGIWVYQVAGIFSTEAEAASWNAQYTDAYPGMSSNGRLVKKHAGDYIFSDINGDKIIDIKDLVFAGYRTPKITGGMQNTFSYKGISIRFTVDYALGHMIEDGALARSLGMGRAFNEGAPAEALGNDIWQKEGDVGKKYARFSLGDADVGQNNFIRQAPVGVGVAQAYSSDVSTMIEKGDFLAFRELSIGYDLPKNLLKKFHSTSLNVFASIYNLGYLTKYKGLNPEAYTGYDPGGYPRPRQFSLGTTLRF
ncbi:MAG: SusC/RagA family TonB-linked outer membrane protein [Segetibacter sp.]|nr:SusC/RagA family TonB-linked outer membrane protein [Segetibacter sp.]